MKINRDRKTIAMCLILYIIAIIGFFFIKPLMTTILIILCILVSLVLIFEREKED